MAEELYLPVGGHPSRTELRIVNPSAATAPVSIEFLGSGAPTTRELTLAAGEHLDLSDPGDEMGVLRITSPVAVHVTANSRCASCEATVSLPLLDQPIDEGQLAAPAAAHALGWQSYVVIVNTDDARATVMFGDRMIRVGARSTRVVSMERLLAAPGVVSFRAPEGVLVFGYDVNARTGARVFSVPRTEAGQKRRRAVRFTSSIPDVPPVPQTVVLTPSKDNTLFESNSGSISNGAGVHLFIGSTASRAIRRALVAFDVASQIPPGSRVTSVKLTVRVSQTISGERPATLHRVQADWGQGSSNAGSSRDGSGTSSRTGDATWRHTFFSTSSWINLGGDFDAAPDAATTVEFSGSVAAWDTSAAMVARVQSWVDQPATNFGWMILGDETTGSSAKRLDSRESPTAGNRPTLTVEFLR